MAEDALIRRENLRRLCSARRWGARELCSHLWGTYPYWRDLLTSPNKSFGEKTARKIEHMLELPRLWLDSDMPVPPAGSAVREPPASYRALRNGLSSELQQKINALSEEELRRLELLIRAHLGLPLA